MSLARIGDRGLVTFGDLSSLLATSDTGGRDAAFGILRRAYDGHVTRDISPPGKPAPGVAEQLSWAGRLTVVAAVTGAIDRYAVHADQLGPRWVYTRIAEPDTAAKKRATDRARKGGLDAHRDAARKTAETLIADAAARIPDDVPDDVFTRDRRSRTRHLLGTRRRTPPRLRPPRDRRHARRRKPAPRRPATPRTRPRAARPRPARANMPPRWPAGSPSTRCPRTAAPYSRRCPGARS